MLDGLMGGMDLGKHLGVCPGLPNHMGLPVPRFCVSRAVPVCARRSVLALATGERARRGKPGRVLKLELAVHQSYTPAAW